jgi:hypothetical protein
LFVSTSAAEFEGFPNVFLEAGNNGAALVSLEADPDGLFTAHGCGVWCGGSPERLAAAVADLWDNTPARAALVERMGEYIRAHHDAGDRAAELHDLLRTLVAADDRPGARTNRYPSPVRS